MNDVLTVGQLNLLCDAAGRAADFVLVDTRAEPRAALVHRRPWSGPGFRVAELAGAAPDQLLRLGVPVVAIRAPGPPHPLLADLFDRSDAVCAVVKHGDGRLTLGGEPRLPDPARREASAALLLTLDREESLPAVRLPLELALELEPGGTHRIALALESGGAAPAREWFTIDAPARTTLTVDVAARPDGDRWLASVTPGRLVRAPAPDEQPPSPPARVAVVLDRTCPDEDAWSQARALALAGSAPAEYRELNAAIRAGLARAVRESGLAAVDALAFADVPGDGLAGIEGVDHPSAAVQSLGGGPAPDAAALFARATYAPGLDLWDPADEALRAALDALGVAPGAVILVGNSPPQVLPEPGGRFDAVARFPGHDTAVRRYGAQWDAELARARALGVRVAYAFLTHGRCGAGDSADLERFQELHELVRTALARDLTVVTGAATEDGVRAAVAQALAALARQEPRRAGVRLARAGA